MSFFTVNITLPRIVELTICARDEWLAWRAAADNALQFWDDNEPICDDEGRLLWMVQIEMPDEGEIELAPDAIEITARKESRQWPELGQVRLTVRGIEL